ncbi:molybdopterin biosynthesis protein moeW [Oleiphilus messinensis]|uniref:Molybdopterin biosynthesis protein moeW n=1 Tax=Oleiphilus messinensis TaxID=141451 RepID=A0A1Y0I6Y7_9GAMM|nr:ThiF family adenylyltransferase [Oleiphilus messinensis]ARU56201.1 molybdopterin biosynthesis protein moeW [Oleiphilus messinensis]
MSASNHSTEATQSAFDYERAFLRNLGLVQPEEQQQLKNCKVAIAGLGGVGGAHVVTLARMGIGNFHLADFDIFELHNFNRQAGAMMSTLGEPKCAVMSRMAKDVNPEANVVPFDEGINADNIDQFLDGVDVVVDGLDFFAVNARDLLYTEARKRALPVVGAGPIGFSMILLTFLPDQMSWHDYFAMDLAKNDTDKYLLFGLGNAPRATHIPYIDKRYVSLDEQRGPSCAAAVQLCAGVIAVEVLKLVLKRGVVKAAPYYHQFDPYRCMYVLGKLRNGNRGWLQRLKFYIFKRFYLSGKVKKDG